MKSYRCRVTDSAGKVEELLLQADTNEDLQAQITAKNLFLLQAKEVQERTASINQKSIISVTEKISTLMASGNQLKHALEMCQRLSTNTNEKQFVESMMHAINKGSSFSSALEPYRSQLPAIYIGMVKIGERIGKLNIILGQLTTFLKRMQKTKEKAVGAMTYPVIVLAIAIFGVIGLSIFILPQFESMFARFGNTDVSPIESLRSMGIGLGVFTVGIISFVIAYFVSKKSAGGLAVAVDSFVLKIPLLGGFFMQQELLNLCFAMDVLTKGGIPLEEGLQETISVISNLKLRNALLQAKSLITRGESIYKAFSADPVFPNDFIMWLGVADETGELGPVFNNLNDYYTNQLELWIQQFEAAINPILIMLVGAIMIFIIMTFVVPMFSMMSAGV